MTELFKKGDRFQVSEPVEIKSPKGMVLARFLPDFDYGVTPRNLEFANGLLAKGKASRAPSARERAAIRFKSGEVGVRGAVNTGPARKSTRGKGASK